jgi:hypothetical protein
MKTISTREFQLHLKDYIDGVEDITLTKKDKVVGYFLHELPKVSISSPVEKVIAEKVYESISVAPKITEVVSQLASISKPKPEYLWDDYNLMPVFKTGEDEQFCSVWHQKGLRLRVYQIKKFRADGSLELEGKFCKACIEGFLKQDGHLE